MNDDLTFPEIPARVQAGVGQPARTDGGLATDMIPTAAMYGDDGSIASGALCLLADTGIGAAVIHGLGADAGIATSHLNIEFVRAVPAGVTSLRCVGRLARVDASYALGTGSVVDSDGDEVALATLGCVIVPRPASDGPAVQAVTGGDASLRVRSSVDELLGSRVVALTAAHCEMSFVASLALANLHGGVHGGMGALMAERTIDRLIRSRPDTAPGRQRLVALRAAYPRRVPANGSRIVCAAETVHRGRRLSMVSARLLDQEGRTAVLIDGTYASDTQP